jgi:surface carbohydrate biosynthesis protein (TIGR04326 family)
MNKTGLIILDEHVSDKDIGDFIGSYTRIIICPLSSDQAILDNVKIVLAKRQCDYSIIDTAKKIYSKSLGIKEALLKWSFEVGEIEINKKANFKQFLYFDDYCNYYSSLISEKNPVKSDLFLEIIQLNVVMDVAKDYKVSALFVSLSSYSLSKSIESKFNKQIFVSPSRFSFKDKLLNEDTMSGAFVRGVGFFLRLCYWVLLAKFMCRTDSKSKHEHLIVSYFPYLKDLNSNQFENLYYQPLQHMLAAKSIKPFWILMFVFVNNIDFKQAIKLRKRFHENGEGLMLLEEFFTISTVTKILFAYLYLVYRYLIVRKDIVSSRVHKNLNIDGTKILEKLCDISFLGKNSVSGLSYYYGYKEVAKRFNSSKTLTYLMEMQAWEKAMLYAFKSAAPGVHTIGYQHTSIASNYYFYFSDPKEVGFNQSECGIPLPKLFAVCGELQKKILNTCPYQDIQVFPAIRKQHLNKLCDFHFYKKKHQILFLGSYDSRETKSSLQLIVSALKKDHRYQEKLILKGHPSCPIEPILKEVSGYQDIKSNIEIVSGSVDEYLESSSLVICGSSSVSIDALMFGCNVIVPLVCDSMNISPLLDYERFCVRVSTACDMSEAISELIAGKNFDAQKEAFSFIHHYWHYDPELKPWKEALQI